MMLKTKPLMAMDSGVVLSPRSEGSDSELPAFGFGKLHETYDVTRPHKMDQWDVNASKEWLVRQGIGFFKC